jgi:hypothetical protein
VEYQPISSEKNAVVDVVSTSKPDSSTTSSEIETSFNETSSMEDSDAGNTTRESDESDFEIFRCKGKRMKHERIFWTDEETDE